jgi:ABC-type nitrate/sulfonate/bicarbonate transport system substrate-binding protein
VRASGLRRLAFLFVAFALVASACGGSEGEAGTETTTGGDGAAERPTGEPSVITFAFAPDPVIDYLRDTGKLAEMEEAWNVKLEMTESWDEFTFFAGGHGQVVSMASYDLPLLKAETGIDTVTFGQYNYNRLPILVRGDSDYQSVEDLAGQKLLVGSQASSTLLWGTLAKEVYDLDLVFDGGDFEVLLSDHAVNPELVARGEAEACICIPEFATPQLRSGELRQLTEAPWQVYNAEVNADHKGLMSNVFTAEKEWYDTHPYEVQFFLALWEEGIKLWQQDKQEIISTYPQHFAVESEEDIAFIQTYMDEQDWFVDSVYLTDEWVAGETGLFELMQSTGFMEAEAEYPEFDVVVPDPSLP